MNTIPYPEGKKLYGESGPLYTLNETVPEHPHVWFAEYRRGLFKVSRKVVVKTSSCDPEQQKSNSIRQLRREMRILSGPLKNINGIITLLDKIYGPISLQLEALVYEYLPFTLESVHKETTLATAEVKTIARQLLQALVVLHHHHIVHTDLKPDNIMMSTNGERAGGSSKIVIKLIDFGLASERGHDQSYTISNKLYRSPEVWLKMPWSFKTDIWSFGVIVTEMLMGPTGNLFAEDVVCFDGMPEGSHDPWRIAVLSMVDFPVRFIQRASDDMQKRISGYPVNITGGGVRKSLSYVRVKRLVDIEHWWFVEAVLKADPNDRPRAQDLLTHPWL